MNYLIIILAIIIILLLYYIYVIFSAVPRVGNRIDLTKAPVIIKPTAITNPYSVNYTMSVWVYIHNFSQNNKIERFIMYGDSNNKDAQSLWSLRMDPKTPTLFCDIKTNSSSNPVIKSFTLTQNFPIQKWVHVVTVVSYGSIECYLNGAFVLTQSIDGGVYQPAPPSNPENSATFSFGALGTTSSIGVRNEGSPVVLNLVSRWDYRLSAGDVYNNYLSGNGEPVNLFGPAYKMNINLERGTTDKYVLHVF